MKIPFSKRKKALILVDVQPGFLNQRNKYIIQNIKDLINNISYDCYIESIFHAEKGSLWQKQTGWILPKDDTFHTVPELLDAVKDKDVLHVEKETKSVFKGNPDIQTELRKRHIEEVHIVGLDVNDCVLASAYEAFDLGFYTYVIEECSEASDSEDIKNTGFEVLRHVNLTNNSCIEKMDVIQIPS